MLDSGMIYQMMSLSVLLLLCVANVSAKEWHVYERCELAEDENADGDSFSVKAGTGYTYVFRLYGVDCAETNSQSASRLKEQLKEFDLEQEAVFSWGEKAAAFTRQFLQKPFIVFTQKIKVGSSGGQSRYYAMIVNAEGKRLDEALIEAGLARSYGEGAEWDEPFWGKNQVDLPKRITSKRFIRKLHALESKAKRGRIGVWER